MPPRKKKDADDSSSTLNIRLMSAVYSGNREECESLFEKGADVAYVGFVAASSSDGNQDEEAQQAAQLIEDLNKDGPFPVWHVAVRYANLEFIEYIALERQCDVNSVIPRSGFTIAHWAVHSEKMEVLQRVLQLRKSVLPSIDLCRVDNLGFTATSLAVQNGNIDMARALIQSDPSSFDFKEKVDGKFTRLQRACIYGDIPLIETLLSIGDSLHQRDSCGNSLIHLARNNFAVIDVLIDRGLLINTRNIRGQTPLMKMIEECWEMQDEVQFLIQKGSDLNAHDFTWRFTPLHYAVSHGSPGLVKKVLESGADPNARDKSGGTALHLIAARGDSGILDAFTSVTKSEPDLNAVDDLGATPLHRACEYGALSIVETLLVREALDPNLVDKRGRSVLHVAVATQNQSCVELLLRRNELEPQPAGTAPGGKKDPKKAKPSGELKKIDIEIEDCEKRSAFHLAVQLQSLGIVQLLGNAGAIVERNSVTHSTLLHEAICLNHTEIILYTLSRASSATVSGALDTFDRSLLIVACARGNYEVVRQLLEIGSDLRVQEISSGNTALHCAVRTGELRIVELLLELSAPILMRNLNGELPIHIALKHKHHSIASTLVERMVTDAPWALDAANIRGETPLHLACECACHSVVKALLDNGARWDVRDNKMWTAMHYTACSGDTDLFSALLNATGVSWKDIQFDRDAMGRSVADLASQHGRADFFCMLIGFARGTLETGTSNLQTDEHLSNTQGFTLSPDEEVFTRDEVPTTESMLC